MVNGIIKKKKWYIYEDNSKKTEILQKFKFKS